MVQMLVLHHAEALARDAAEDLARGPGGARATLAIAPCRTDKYVDAVTALTRSEKLREF